MDEQFGLLFKILEKTVPGLSAYKELMEKRHELGKMEAVREVYEMIGGELQSTLSALLEKISDREVTIKKLDVQLRRTKQEVEIKNNIIRILTNELDYYKKNRKSVDPEATEVSRDSGKVVWPNVKSYYEDRWWAIEYMSSTVEELSNLVDRDVMYDSLRDEKSLDNHISNVEKVNLELTDAFYDLCDFIVSVDKVFDDIWKIQCLSLNLEVKKELRCAIKDAFEELVLTTACNKAIQQRVDHILLCVNSVYRAGYVRGWEDRRMESKETQSCD